MNVGPNALHKGPRTDATFLDRGLLKSTCPDDLRKDAFVVVLSKINKNEKQKRFNWMIM